MSTSNVQSTITPSTNGVDVDSVIADKLAKAQAKAEAKAAAKAAKLLASTTALTPVPTPATLTAAEAVAVAYEYGNSVAGLDGTLTNAIKLFKDSATVMADMLAALNVGYMARKLGVDKAKATEIVGLLKHNPNPKKADDHHRTFEQQRIMDSVRVIWHRAQKMAGVVHVKSDAQVEAEKTRAAKEAAKVETEARLIKADEIVNPKADVDVTEALTRLVSTMRSLANKHSDKLVGDKGMAWRDWLANAPK